MIDLAILSLKFIFFILIFLKKLKQNICSYICFTLALIHLKMISKELLGSTELLGAQIFLIHKITNVIVIYKDENLIFITF